MTGKDKIVVFLGIALNVVVAAIVLFGSTNFFA